MYNVTRYECLAVIYLTPLDLINEDLQGLLRTQTLFLGDDRNQKNLDGDCFVHAYCLISIETFQSDRKFQIGTAWHTQPDMTLTSGLSLEAVLQQHPQFSPPLWLCSESSCSAKAQAAPRRVFNIHPCMHIPIRCEYTIRLHPDFWQNPRRSIVIVLDFALPLDCYLCRASCISVNAHHST